MSRPQATSRRLSDLLIWWRKAKALFSIWIQDGIAYRTSGFIWVLTEVTTAVSMPLVWAAAARSNGGPVGGFSTSGIVLYYLVMLLLGGFISSHILWDIALEIKEGQFSTVLMRPISVFQYTFIRNLAWRLIRPALFLPFFCVILFFYRDMVRIQDLHPSLQFVLSMILGHLVSFTSVFALAMVAFFTEEAMSIFEIYYIPLMLFSGQIFPVSMMPAWADKLAKLLPFYYTVGLPTEVLIGKVSPAEGWRGVGMQVAWIGISLLAGHLLWKSGTRRYTGVGM